MKGAGSSDGLTPLTPERGARRCDITSLSDWMRWNDVAPPTSRFPPALRVAVSAAPHDTTQVTSGNTELG